MYYQAMPPFYHKNPGYKIHLSQSLPGVIIYPLGISLNQCVISGEATSVVLDGAPRYEPFHGIAARAANTPANYLGRPHPGDFALLLCWSLDGAGGAKPG
jgi:hypothetical protein